MTDVPLREHLEAQMEDLRRSAASRMENNDRMNRQRFEVLARRIEESRQYINERTESELGKQDERIQALETAKTRLDARLAAIAVGVSFAVSVIMWLVSLWIRGGG